MRSYATTALALVGAAVIVTTPITPQPADIRVSASQFASGGDHAAHVLDPAFLDSLRSNSLQMLYPITVIRQWLERMVDDVKKIGGEELSPDGAVTVDEPEVTLDTFVTSPGHKADLVPSVAGAEVADLTTIVQRALEHLGDATYVSGAVVAAALASVVATANAPWLILGALSAAAEGDLTAAADRLALAATASFGPPIAIVEAVRTAVEARPAGRSVADSAAIDVPQAAPAPDVAVSDHGAFATADEAAAAEIGASATPATELQANQDVPTVESTDESIESAADDTATRATRNRTTALSPDADLSHEDAGEPDMRSGNKVETDPADGVADHAEGDVASPVGGRVATTLDGPAGGDTDADEPDSAPTR